MRILLDTNILTRLTQTAHPHHDRTLVALKQLRSRGDTPCIVPQVLYEYWVVATRPQGENGLGMTKDDAARDLVKMKELFQLLRDERAILREWEQLVVAHDVKGKSGHDARLVAAMNRHGIRALLTSNPAHFTRFRQITVITPDELAR